jgi:hypothetical protein
LPFRSIRLSLHYGICGAQTTEAPFPYGFWGEERFLSAISMSCNVPTVMGSPLTVTDAFRVPLFNSSSDAFLARLRNFGNVAFKPVRLDASLLEQRSLGG